MARPDDIPEDVWEAAVYRSSYVACSHAVYLEVRECVARAIMAGRKAERERCANIAFDDGKTYGGQGAEWLAGHMYARRKIADAIRGGHQ